MKKEQLPSAEPSKEEPSSILPETSTIDNLILKEKLANSPVRDSFLDEIYFTSEGSLLFHSKNVYTPPESYSIRQLCLQMRRAIPSQRQSALRIWRRVFQKISQSTSADTDTKELTQSLETILKEDFVLHFLRSSLDDTYRSSLTEAFLMMANLFNWILNESDGISVKDIPEKKTQYEIISRLLGMELLPRCRYLLEIDREELAINHAIIDILWRLVRAKDIWIVEVVQCPRIINALCESLLIESNIKYVQRLLDVILALIYHLDKDTLQHQSTRVSFTRILLERGCIKRLLDDVSSQKWFTCDEGTQSYQLHEDIGKFFQLAIDVEVSVGLDWMNYVRLMNTEASEFRSLPSSIWICLENLAKKHLLGASKTQENLELLVPIVSWASHWFEELNGVSLEISSDLLVAIRSVVFFLESYQDSCDKSLQLISPTIVDFIYRWVSSCAKSIIDEKQEKEFRHLEHFYGISSLLVKAISYGSCFDETSPFKRFVKDNVSEQSTMGWIDLVERDLKMVLSQLEESSSLSAKRIYPFELVWEMWNFAFQAFYWFSTHTKSLSFSERLRILVRLLNTGDILGLSRKAQSKKKSYQKSIDVLFRKFLLDKHCIETIFQSDSSQLAAFSKYLVPLFQFDVPAEVVVDVDLNRKQDEVISTFNWLWAPMKRASDYYRNESLTTYLSIIDTIFSWLSFLEKLERSISFMLGSSIGKRLFFLMNLCLFSDEDVFLDKDICHAMTSFLRRTIEFSRNDSQPWRISNEFSNDVVESEAFFNEFYLKLLDRFHDSSYGNILFTNLILLPCTSIHSIDYRLTLLSSSSLSLASLLRISPSEILASPPTLASFISPIESDPQVLRQFARLLLHPRIQPDRTLFIYLWSMHHLQHRLGSLSLSSSGEVDQESITKDEKEFFRSFLLSLIQLAPGKFEDFLKLDCLKKFSQDGWPETLLTPQDNGLIIVDQVKSLFSTPDEKNLLKPTFDLLSISY